MIRIGVTGHRPEKLGGYGLNPARLAMREAFKEHLFPVNPAPGQRRRSGTTASRLPGDRRSAASVRHCPSEELA